MTSDMQTVEAWLVRFHRETKILSGTGLAIITAGQRNMAVFCPWGESVREAELKSNRPISLVGEISR